MATIWKYAVPPRNVFELELPFGAKFLAVQAQRSIPQAWFLVDPVLTIEARRFVIVATGDHVDRAEELTYLGTFQLNEGELVLHLFELL